MNVRPDCVKNSEHQLFKFNFVSALDNHSPQFPIVQLKLQLNDVLSIVCRMLAFSDTFIVSDNSSKSLEMYEMSREETKPE